MGKQDALFLGIDIGTSGLRSCVIDINDDTIAETSTALAAPIVVGQKIEQDPRLWWQACCDCINQLAQQIDLNQIQSICLDGTSATLVLTDSDGNPLGNGLMYNDTRAENQLENIKQQAPSDSAVHSASSTLAKVLWYRDAGLLKQASYILHQCDWITSQFTQQFGISDINNCMKLGFDAINHKWPSWLDKLSVPINKLPKVLKPGHVISNIDTSVAKQFGFSTDTIICAGTTDSTAAVIATGISDVGMAVTSLGSTLVLKVISSKPIFAAEYGIYSQPLFNHWLVGGASNTGGAALLKHFTVDQLSAMTEQLKPEQMTGLDYYPLPGRGERFPINDPSLASACEPRPTDNVDFFQALLEGIANIEKQGYDLLSKLGAPYPSTVYSVGGGAKNKAWQSIRSSKLQIPVELATHQQAAYGSALLAKYGKTEF